jgi:hypothetical protein
MSEPQADGDQFLDEIPPNVPQDANPGQSADKPRGKTTRRRPMAVRPSDSRRPTGTASAVSGRCWLKHVSMLLSPRPLLDTEFRPPERLERDHQ